MAALGWVFYRDHLSGHIAAAEASSAAVHRDDRAKITFEQRLEQERTLRRDLEQQLAARLVEQEALQNVRRKDVEQQQAARQTDQELLAKERARSNDLEQRLAARQTSEQAIVVALARERAHTQALEQELATRANATPGGERDANVRLSVPASDSPAPPAPIEHTATPAPIPADKVARAEPPAPPQAADVEVVRLMARAKRLLEQGDVGAARSVLERAVEAGSALATFALAELRPDRPVGVGHCRHARRRGEGAATLRQSRGRRGRGREGSTEDATLTNSRPLAGSLAMLRPMIEFDPDRPCRVHDRGGPP